MARRTREPVDPAPCPTLARGAAPPWRSSPSSPRRALRRRAGTRGHRAVRYQLPVLTFPCVLLLRRSTNYTPAAANPARRLPAIVFAHRGIEPFDITLNLLARPFVNDLTPHDVANVGLAGARRSQRTPDAVHPFAKNNLNPVNPLAQNRDIHGLAGRGHAHFDFLGIHKSPVSADVDFLDDFSNPQALGANATLAATLHGNRDAAPRYAAAAALVEDVLVVEPAPPAFEMADLGARVARVDGAAALRLAFHEHPRVERQLLRRVQHVRWQVPCVRHVDLDAAVRVARLHLERRRHRRHAQVHGGLALADVREHLAGRAVQADGRHRAPDLALPELRMTKALPAAEDAAAILLAVELRQRQQVLARKPAEVIHKRLLALDAEAREQIPELAGISDRAARVVDEVGDVAVDRFLGLVDELLEAAHHRMAAELLAPFLDLPVNREIFLVHFLVGRVAERADVDAAEGVQVQPGEDIRMPDRPVDHRARLGLACAVRPGADLLGLGLPGVRKIAIEVDVVVREKVRIGHVGGVVVLDRALGPPLVERTGILQPARQHHAGQLAVLDEFAGRVLPAQREHHAVAVDVARDPARNRSVLTTIARIGAHVTAVAQHCFGAIRRHARQHVEQDAFQPLAHMLA